MLRSRCVTYRLRKFGMVWLCKNSVQKFGHHHYAALALRHVPVEQKLVVQKFGAKIRSPPPLLLLPHPNIIVVGMYFVLRTLYLFTFPIWIYLFIISNFLEFGIN